MTFRLEKSTASTRKLSKFNVLNADGDLIGSINVKPSEENDLRAHWKDVSPSSPKKSANASKQVSAMAAARRKQRPSREAILRGC